MITPQINKQEHLQKELDCLKFPWWNMVGLSGGLAGLKKEEKFDDLIRNQVELNSEILVKSVNNTRAN